MSGAQARPRVCVDCHMTIMANTVAQAKRAGWDLWVGGARCKSCVDHLAGLADMTPGQVYAVKFVPADWKSDRPWKEITDMGQIMEYARKLGNGPEGYHMLERPKLVREEIVGRGVFGVPEEVP